MYTEVVHTPKASTRQFDAVLEALLSAPPLPMAAISPKMAKAKASKTRSVNPR